MTCLLRQGGDEETVRQWKTGLIYHTNFEMVLVSIWTVYLLDFRRSFHHTSLFRSFRMLSSQEFIKWQYVPLEVGSSVVKSRSGKLVDIGA